MSIHDESWDRPTCEHCNQTIEYGEKAAHLNCRFDKYVGKKVQLSVKLAAMPPFWFTNIVKDAQALLEEGKVYTVKAAHPASSWCAVELEGVAAQFNLGWFSIVGEPEENLLGNLEW